MPRPKKVIITLKEKIRLLKEAGIRVPHPVREGSEEEDQLESLPHRIQSILGVVRHQPQKATTMNYLILYDIEDNKVRRLVAKYLEQKGCIRIQKSVFMANTTNEKFIEIHETLKDINEFYENSDSIIVVPVNVADVRSMKLIGKNVNIDILTNPPTTLFF
jgi:CRISPR-associated endonuclease Cas2